MVGYPLNAQDLKSPRNFALVLSLAIWGGGGVDHPPHNDANLPTWPAFFKGLVKARQADLDKELHLCAERC